MKAFISFILLKLQVLDSGLSGIVGPAARRVVQEEGQETENVSNLRLLTGHVRVMVHRLKAAYARVGTALD